MKVIFLKVNFRGDTIILTINFWGKGERLYDQLLRKVMFQRPFFEINRRSNYQLLMRKMSDMAINFWWKRECLDDQILRGNEHFIRSTFEGEGCSNDQLLREKRTFWLSTCEGKVSLGESTFDGNGVCWRSTFEGKWELIRSTFKGKIIIPIPNIKFLNTVSPSKNVWQPDYLKISQIKILSNWNCIQTKRSKLHQ